MRSRSSRFDHNSEAAANSHSFLWTLQEAERRDAEAHEAALAQAYAECVLSNAAAKKDEQQRKELESLREAAK